ncbi:MAG TPA: hypothetical protein VJZ72_07810 [Candidatus Limnocylindrales bacterium]|nr:hypothetical protein [Candidatus Limnocylindrales bacterium]
MTLQLHRPDAEGGLEVVAPVSDDHRTQLKAQRWGSSLHRGRLPRLANTEMEPTPAWLAVGLWAGLALVTFVIIVLGYGTGFWG